MFFRIFLSFVLLHAHFSYATTVYWWNTGRGGIDIYGNLPDRNANQRNELFNFGLRSIARGDDVPEILILGEYVPYSIERGTERFLESTYRHSQFIPYNPKEPEFGIRVLSKEKPTDVITNSLGFAPLHMTPNAAKDFQEKYTEGWVGDPFEKTYLQMKFGKGNDSFTIVPVHLMQPWQQIMKEKGVIAIGKDLLFGTENPNWYQVNRLTDKVLANAPSTNVFVFGDFNFPRTVARIQTVGYKHMTSLFDNLFGHSVSTFPSDKIALMQLDHAFKTRGSTKVKVDVPRVRGSDHYPIRLRIGR